MTRTRSPRRNQAPQRPGFGAAGIAIGAGIALWWLLREEDGEAPAGAVARPTKDTKPAVPGPTQPQDGRVYEDALRLGANLSSVAALAPAVPESRGDRLLARCLAPKQIERIVRQFNIRWDEGVPPPTCPQPDGSPSATYNLVSALAALEDVTFDLPVPVLESSRPYDWLASRGLSFRVRRGQQYSSAGGNEVWLREEDLSQPWDRVMVHPSSGTGALYLMQLLVHEAKHVGADGRAHDWGFGQDSSLSYGGAWAAAYYFLRWMAERTPSNWLSPYAREQAQASAQRILTERFGRADEMIADLNRICHLVSKGQPVSEAEQKWMLRVTEVWIPNPADRTIDNACWAWARIDPPVRVGRLDWISHPH